MTLYDPDDSRHDRQTPAEAAAIAAWLASNQPTQCPPMTYSESFTLSWRDQIQTQSRADIARKTPKRTPRTMPRQYLHGGEMLTIAQIVERTGIAERTIRSRLSKFGSTEAPVKNTAKWCPVKVGDRVWPSQIAFAAHVGVVRSTVSRWLEEGDMARMERAVAEAEGRAA